MEIPIDRSCIIKKILVNVGDLISPGQNILEIENIDTPKVNKDTIIENIDNQIGTDLNNDNQINIQDIILLVSMILD